LARELLEQPAEESMQESAIEKMVSVSARQIDLDAKSLAEAITACLECAAVCTMCADACAAEADVAELRRCIRLNLDCADISTAVARVLGRTGDPHSGALLAIVEACEEICVGCAAECQKHSMHEHCQRCAEACGQCARACQRVSAVLIEGPSS
jgi:hypothetical protein